MPQSLNDTGESALESLISTVGQKFSMTAEKGVQADESGDLLSRKMRALDLDYQQLHASGDQGAAEKRMLEYQKSCDERMAVEL